MVMELPRLIEALSSPAAYPYPADSIEVHQTHISVVFLAGPFAYKVKKPVALGFLDFSTSAKRAFFANEEVRLNRRLAPSVYLGVVPICQVGENLKIEGSGEPIDWAVKMTRLPDESRLLNKVQRGEVDRGVIELFAERIAGFHASAAAGEAISAYGRFEVVARNARDNLAQASSLVGTTICSAVFDRVASLTERALAGLRPLIDARAERGVTRDTHGDLRLDHLYYFPERRPPEDVIVVDCIEFNESFRYADPIADMAFLAMDLIFHGRRDLADAFREAYLRAARDDEGRALLLFYTAYRAAVRGKVEGIKLSEQEIPLEEREAAQENARSHWLLALGELESPNKRPCLVLMMGLPGCGKSTLARGLAERAGFVVLRSDLVRKELAGLGPTFRASAAFETGIYSAEQTERTYAECVKRAEGLLLEGRRVIVDATFREDGRRRTFLALARRRCIPALALHCRADLFSIRKRLEERQGDVSDADWQVLVDVERRWEPLGEQTSPSTKTISNNGPQELALQQALEALRELQVYA
jgi:aminoglycoside phosphotransferase family enzyme/predicted kinase